MTLKQAKAKKFSKHTCPACGHWWYTATALTKHRMTVHGYVPSPTRRQLQVLARKQQEAG